PGTRASVDGLGAYGRRSTASSVGPPVRQCGAREASADGEAGQRPATPVHTPIVRPIGSRASQGRRRTNPLWGRGWHDVAANWALDPDIVFLNHGSFGATPRPVLAAQDAWRKVMEREPADFLWRLLSGRLD